MRWPPFAVLALSSIAAIFIAGCFRPTVNDGLPCTEDRQCPAGQSCSPLGVCLESAATGADSGLVGYDGGFVPLPDSAPGTEAECSSPFAFELSNLARCDLPTVEAALTLSGVGLVIDTDAAELRTAGGNVLGAIGHVVAQTDASASDVLLLHVQGFTVPAGSSVRAIGARPLIIASTADISIEGELSVAATLTAGGAGAGPLGCVLAGAGAAGARNEVAANIFAGTGGGGGGFGAAGGPGGGIGSGAVGGAGGADNGFGALTPLRGGCWGGEGGDGIVDAQDMMHPGGLGGAGGGALQLSAAGTLVISATGVITAGGGGGRAGQATGDVDAALTGSGGGGGGSGGAVLLEGDRIEVFGAVTANGGGGGEGMIATSIGVADGSDADAASADPAAGGDTADGYNYGGIGGNGGSAVVPAQAGGPGLLSVPTYGFADPGAGGGGAIGRVHFRADSELVSDAAAIISPPNL